MSHDQRSLVLDGVAAGASRAARIGLGNDTKEPCPVKSETLFRRRGGGVSRSPVNGWLGFQQAKDEVIDNSAENPCTASASPDRNT